MAAMLDMLLNWKAAILYAFLASALFVHFRGSVRIRFYRQVTDHSTFMAPYNALMYFFSAVPNRPFIDIAQFPDLKPVTDNWQMLRDEALQLFDEGYIRGTAKYNDLGFNSGYSPNLSLEHAAFANVGVPIRHVLEVDQYLERTFARNRCPHHQVDDVALADRLHIQASYAGLRRHGG